MQPPNKQKAVLTWWQWLLMYPTLILAIGAASPTLYNWGVSLWVGVPPNKLQIAEEQRRLWNKNCDCLNGKIFQDIPAPGSYKVSAIVCERTGDVLVRVTDNEGKPHTWWVAARSIVTTASTSSEGTTLVSDARATEIAMHTRKLAQQVRSVLCQRSLNSREILLRIKSDGSCFDEIINTYTGAVVKRQPAPCNPDCR